MEKQEALILPPEEFRSEIIRCFFEAQNLDWFVRVPMRIRLAKDDNESVTEDEVFEVMCKTWVVTKQKVISEMHAMRHEGLLKLWGNGSYTFATPEELVRLKHDKV